MADEKKNGNKNMIYQIVAVLGAMGLLGGGGYVASDAIKSNVAVIETQLVNTNENLSRLDETVNTLTTQIVPVIQQVATLQKQMDVFSQEFRAEFREHINHPDLHLLGMTKIRNDLIEKLNELQQKITRLEAKLLNNGHPKKE